jgi:hypothetical protein
MSISIRLRISREEVSMTLHRNPRHPTCRYLPHISWSVSLQRRASQSIIIQSRGRRSRADALHRKTALSR